MTGSFWNLAWGYPTLNKIICKGPPKHLKLKRAQRALHVAEGHQRTAGARKLAGRRPANFSSFNINVRDLWILCIWNIIRHIFSIYHIFNFRGIHCYCRINTTTESYIFKVCQILEEDTRWHHVLLYTRTVGANGPRVLESGSPVIFILPPTPPPHII